jgi:hypothetical protein
VEIKKILHNSSIYHKLQIKRKKLNILKINHTDNHSIQRIRISGSFENYSIFYCKTCRIPCEAPHSPHNEFPRSKTFLKKYGKTGKEKMTTENDNK